MGVFKLVDFLAFFELLERLGAGDPFLELESPTFCFPFETMGDASSEREPVGFFCNISDRRDEFGEERGEEEKSEGSCCPWAASSVCAGRLLFSFGK